MSARAGDRRRWSGGRSSGARALCVVPIVLVALAHLPAGCTWDWDTLEQGTAEVPALDAATPDARAISVELVASAACVAADGALSLTWTSEGATECEVSGPSWVGPRATNGMESVGEPASGLYTIRCTGDAGEASDSAMVLVDDGTAMPPMDAVVAPFGARDLSDGTTDEWQTERHLAEELQEGMYPGSRDLVATFRPAWDAERFYVTVSIVDDDLQYVAGAAELDHDLVEVMINGRNDEAYRTPAGGWRFDVDDHRLAFSPEGVLWTTDPAQPRGDDVVQQAYLTTQGWEVEVGIRWPFVIGEDGHVPSPGDLVGFNVAAVDRDDGEATQATVVWRLTEYRWRNTTGWGTVVLRCSLASP